MYKYQGQAFTSFQALWLFASATKARKLTKSY